ncbi:MAG TPA: sigma 54-interacting transcriptional regulator [Kofleriaceae bacterium]|nr:sigma 54-interacting transcriptional regulator [Kofleriaceae bacterium]
MATSVARPTLLHGRFDQVRIVGSGSFGRVFEVIDVLTGDRRALKVVPGGPHEAALLDEFEQLAKLRHPSLPRVFEVGRTTEVIHVGGGGEAIAAGAPFFVAEWIEGARCDDRPWSGDDAALWSVLADLAGALATIHAAGLVHADVAPQNVLVTDGRAVLVDLGLARGRGARGTPAYMAPEALAGHVEPRSDLYGLGATALRIVGGRAPFEAPTLGALAQRIVRGERVVDPPPGPLGDLIRRLVARELDARPVSALAVLDELDQLAPVIAPQATRRARPRVAPVPATWAGATPWIRELAAALDASEPVLVVVGAPASGARSLVDAAVREAQLDEVARGARSTPAIAGVLDVVASRLGIAASSEAASARGWLERVARAARSAQARIVLELGDDPRARDVIAALGRAEGGWPVIAIVDPARAPDLPADVRRRHAPVLDEAGTDALATALLGVAPPRAWLRGLHAAAQGLPLAVVELVRSIADEPEPFAIDWSARAAEGVTALRARALAPASPGARRIAAAIAIWNGHARLDDVLAVVRATETTAAGRPGLAEVAELEHLGLVRRSGAELACDRAARDAIERVVGGALLAAFASAALAIVARSDVDAVAALLERADLADHAELACDVAGELLARGRGDRALVLARRAIAHAPVRAALIASRAAAATGAYRDAIDHARAARDAGADPVEAELAIARAAQRAGELDAAEATLAALARAHPAHAEVAGTYARLLVTRSRYADARRIALAPGGPLTGLRAEAAGLAAFYLGALDDADGAFAALEVGATAAHEPAMIGRALSLRGMVAQQRGQLAMASDRYRDAARRLLEAGELHAAAVAELNLGTVLSERGRASEALPRLAAASRVFAELGATTELAAADFNRGNALLAVGQLDDAQAAADASLARTEGAPHLRAYALLLAGDVARRRDDEATAIGHYRAALAIGVERGDAHVQAHAHVALAEVGERTADDAAVEALCASADDRDRWTLARGRLALRTRDASAAATLARACAAVATRAREGDRLERALRGHAIASRLAALAGDPVLQRTEAERARAAHAAIVAAAAPAFRATLAADPDLAALPAIAPEPAPRTRGAAVTEATLRRLLTLSRRLNTEANVERILDEVIDTAIELTAAERGFLLLRQDTGLLEPVVSRNFAIGDLATEQASVSRSIAEQAAQSGEPVVTVDAGIDERFGSSASVAALRLRSVLVVPLRQRGTVTGCIYVDHRLRGGAFDDAAASLLGELADIAAIAIENARLTADLRRTTHEVDQLNARLSAELAEKDAELVRVKADLPDRDRLRHRYERIVGRAPATVRMLELVDRAAATALPVVITGESGTGKELVARALHDHGPRKAGPFVAINCSAVPEPLLESELFGHVRGAFTGAERDRRGLFEVADGGTLFLDEIADTSPSMQAKLLRVLQDGMVRRVGDSKTRKVDVRVVAASQRPLAELVAGGRFREDLRFRLEVITIAVPALRDRDGDIPLLVEAVLAQLCADHKPPKLTRAAMRALAQHRWPGNVRELENALARGVAMGGDVIDLADLPEAIATSAGRPEPQKPLVGDDLRLKPALTATEQAYISAAMARAKGNQTVAARLLGLSRFGLQKKLRRLAGDDVDDD